MTEWPCESGANSLATIGVGLPRFQPLRSGYGLLTRLVTSVGLTKWKRHRLVLRASLQIFPVRLYIDSFTQNGFLLFFHFLIAKMWTVIAKVVPRKGWWSEAHLSTSLLRPISVGISRGLFDKTSLTITCPH